MRFLRATAGLVMTLGLLLTGCPCNSVDLTGPDDGYVQDAPAAPAAPAALTDAE